MTEPNQQNSDPKPPRGEHWGWRIANLTVLVVVAAVTGIMSWRTNKSMESLRPRVAEETLRSENLVNSKRDAYYEAIGVMSRYMAATAEYADNPKRVPPGKTTAPTEAEVNAAKAKLVLHTDDPRVVSQFDSLLVESNNLIRTFGQFIQLAREDMGYATCSLPGTYKYIFLRH